MINAKEARDIVETSDANVLKSLEVFDKNIRNAASRGKKECFFHIDSREKYLGLPPLKPLEMMIVERLKDSGFWVEFTFDGDPYVPRGLSDDEGDGPKHSNYGFMVRW